MSFPSPWVARRITWTELYKEKAWRVDWFVSPSTFGSVSPSRLAPSLHITFNSHNSLSSTSSSFFSFSFAISYISNFRFCFLSPFYSLCFHSLTCVSLGCIYLPVSSLSSFISFYVLVWYLHNVLRLPCFSYPFKSHFSS